MLTASYLLAGLAIVLAWPAPVVLSRSRWTSRSPFTALLLWQAIALAGGLSMIGAFLVWGLEPLGANLISALDGLRLVLLNGPAAPRLEAVHVFALSTALLLGGHLVFTLLLTAYKVTRQRARHRKLLALLTDPSPTSPGTVVLEHQAPVAYCLPGLNGSVTVLSRGLLDALDAEGLRGVIAHERAHLDQRHDLLVLAFESWHQALPWLPTSRLARLAVQELIEMLADDAALQQVSRASLLRSLLAVAAGERQQPAAGQAEPSKGPSPLATPADPGSTRGGAGPAQVPGSSASANAAAIGGSSAAGDGDSSAAASAAGDGCSSAAADGCSTGRTATGPLLPAEVGIPSLELSSLRLKRLLSPAAELPVWGRLAVLAVAALLLCVPTLALIAPGLLV